MDEAERERILDEATRAIRARDDLLAIVAHDLTNPLNVVRLDAALIDQVSADGSVRKHAKSILRSVDQMVRLIRDLIDLASLEAGHLLPVAPRLERGTELAPEAAEVLTPLANARHLTLVIDLAHDHCELLCDGGRVQQLLATLIGNAIRFTREGGVITVRTRRSGPHVVFSVGDNGDGIPDAELAHVFDARGQAQATRQSADGLGLAVGKGIVEAHGGRIWVESVVGRGSTFYAALPSLAGASSEARAAEAQQELR